MSICFWGCACGCVRACMCVRVCVRALSSSWPGVSSPVYIYLWLRLQVLIQVFAARAPPLDTCVGRFQLTLLSTCISSLLFPQPPLSKYSGFPCIWAGGSGGGGRGVWPEINMLWPQRLITPIISHRIYKFRSRYKVINLDQHVDTRSSAPSF